MKHALLAASVLMASPASRPLEGIKAGTEFPLLADGPGRGLQGAPAVAFGKDQFLAIWREGWHGKGGSARIFGARFSLDGRSLDPKGIELAPARAGVQERPRVAFGGGVFLVVWQDLRNGKDYDVFAARLSPDGKILDPEPIRVAAGPRNQVLPDVASDGKGFLVVWQGLEGEDTIYRGWTVPVSAAGKVGEPVVTGMSPQPKIAWNGTHYLVASGGAGGLPGTVHGVRLDPEGKPQGKPTIVIWGTKAAAFSLSAVPGKGWLAVSHRSPPDPWGWGGPGAMRASFVNAEGQPETRDAVRDPGGKERSPSWLDFALAKQEGGGWPWGQSASAFDGRRSVVVWPRHRLTGEKKTNFENGDLIAARVDGHATRDPEGIPVAASSDEERAPALAGGGTGRLLLVYERHSESGEVGVFGRVLESE